MNTAQFISTTTIFLFFCVAGSAQAATVKDQPEPEVRESNTVVGAETVQTDKESEAGAVQDKQKPGADQSERSFVDRNGDGINDCMEHRFRRKGRRGKGRRGSQQQQQQQQDSSGSLSGGQGAGNGFQPFGNAAGTGPDGTGANGGEIQSNPNGGGRKL